MILPFPRQRRKQSDPNFHLLSVLSASTFNFGGKMSENVVFYSETKGILETAINTAADIIWSSHEEVLRKPQNTKLKVSWRFIF